MAPRSTRKNIGNCRTRDTEPFGQIAMKRSSRFEKSNLSYGVFRQLRVSNVASYQNATMKSVEAVLNVFAARNPFKVYESVVSANSVLMVGVGPFGIDSVKCFEHQAVNSDLSNFAIFAQSNVEVASGHAPRFNYANFASVIRTVSAHLSKIVDRVKTLKARYCDPQFVEVNIVRHFDLSLRDWLIWLGVRGGDHRSDADFFFTANL